MGKNTDPYTPELAAEICRRLAEGESLLSICRDKSMPSKSTVMKWFINDYKGFAPQYAQAREAQAHAFADELADIADNGTNDWMERNDPTNPGWLANGEHAKRSQLRIDARKWAASKILPKVYGDTRQVDLNANINHLLQVMPADQRLDRARSLIARAQALIAQQTIEGAVELDPPGDE